ncbi:MAG: hypothetical protein IPG07_08445 [Crocinitomicaceae bacterium]|nr:hypothetical protein [Crocinitomicaceae bacterium]
MDLAIDTISTIISSDTLSFLSDQRDLYYNQLSFDLLSGSPGTISSNEPSMLFVTEMEPEFSDKEITESENLYHYYDQQIFIKSVTLSETQRFKTEQNYNMLIRDIKIGELTILEFIATSVENDLSENEISNLIAQAIVGHFKIMLNSNLSLE